MRKRGFTLVELLIVIAIVSLLVTMLLPALANARALTRIAQCGANMRQQGVMVGQYEADCRDNLPMPTTSHRLTESNLSASTRWYLQPNNSIDMFTRNNSSFVCPLGIPGTWPTGYGWFYWQGYIQPYTRQPAGKIKNVVGIFDCPGTPGYSFRTSASPVVTYGETQLEWIEDWVGQYSNTTNALANHDEVNEHNPGGVNTAYDCYPQSYEGLGYINRGWALNSVNVVANRSMNWKPGNAWAIDSEHWLNGNLAPNYTLYDLVYPRKHAMGAGGINIMFIDGHVKYGGRDHGITTGTVSRSVPYSIWLAVTNNSASLDVAFQSASSGLYYPAAGMSDSHHTKLWAYYEGN